MEKHLPYLDGWRGLAITCLLIGHFFPVAGINFGSVGVALFFVLSGLLMSRVLFVQRTSFKTFYRRRISRVFPSVAIYITVITLVFIASSQVIDSRELMSAATFTNNYFVAEKWTMPLGHIWSLSVEEHSYVILSIAAFWCRSKGGRGLLAIASILIFILGAIAIYSFVPDAYAPNYRLRTEVASFGIFASGFLLLLVHHKKICVTQPWVAPVALLVGIMSFWWSIPGPVQVVAGCGALAMAINAMHSGPTMFIRLFEAWWLRKFGLYSFSLYLWQQPYYQLVWRYDMSPWLGLILAMITGAIAYHVIEKPARTYINQQWGAPRPLVKDENVVEIKN